MNPGHALYLEFRRGTAAVALVIVFIASGAFAQNSTTVNHVSYEGTLGKAHIGLTVLVKGDNTGGSTISGGHYFYAKHLTDISLTGSMKASALSLQGADGGTFALKFKGNGSEDGKPLDFNNSVGLDGTWSGKDGKSLPVSLAASGQAVASKSGRWYEMVTDESDAAFEAKAQGFYKAALAGDRDAAAKCVDFPLRVNQNGKSRTIKSAGELSAQWEKIFTPAYVAALKKDMPHDMGISNGQAMLGSGEVWFGSKGASVLNLP